MQAHIPRWNILKEIQFDSYLYQMQLVSTATILMKNVLLYFLYLLLFAYVVNLRLVEINLKT